MPAIQSSAMIPKPPGRDSACRAGNGFQISNTRKSIKPSSKYFQLGKITMLVLSGWLLHRMGWPYDEMLVGCACQGQKPPRRRASCCPETSSMTTLCGSLVLQYVAARCAVQNPINATPTVIRHWMKIKESKVSTPLEWISTPAPPPANAPRSMNQKGNIARAIPASEPNVPGALG